MDEKTMQDAEAMEPEADVLGLTDEQLEVLSGGKLSDFGKSIIRDNIKSMKRDQHHTLEEYLHIYRFKDIRPDRKAEQMAYIKEVWDSI